MMILLTSLTSSLSAAAETSSAPPPSTTSLRRPDRRACRRCRRCRPPPRRRRLERVLELLQRRDAIHQLAPREDVLDDARALDPLRVEAQDDQAFLGVLDRHPLVGFDVLALQVLQQIHRLDAIRLEGLVGDAEELRQRRADRGELDLEFLGQDVLDVDRLLARRARRKLELRRRYHRVADQEVVLCLEDLRLLALLERDRQRLSTARSPLLRRAGRKARRPCC